MEEHTPGALRRLVARGRLLRMVSARGSLVRPTDAPQVFVGGRRSMRVLVAGSGPVAGWGVGSHDLALPGALARALAATTGRGAVVDVLPHPSGGVRWLRKALAGADLERYDAIVLSAAVADALRMVDPVRWARHVEAVLRMAHGGERAVVWLGAQPIRSIRPYDTPDGDEAERHAERLNEAARAACRATGAVFLPMPAPPAPEAGRHRSPADYLFWARLIADAVAPAVHGRPAAPAHLSGPEDRVQAIERLGLPGPGAEPTDRTARLEGLVGTARRTLGTEVAMFTVLDDRREWPLAAVGATLVEIPIEQSACIHTIRSADGMVVPDAEHDERFAASDLVTGPANLRFYAGYPVEAPDGTRIGALCVFGRRARDAAESETDLDVLRELALLAQRELWRWEGGAD
ncbi:GDSL-type esterase/lipase family protein [Leifsonia sp. NPDC080035]|uniref:GDSL-type esterase/lipase family protein n=1 Tax=Leifsonia sp. NPDC080035 TaxID=3143936 RepID=A0AAU7GEV3_9MICO